MPGMMDTVLNLGLNHDNVEGMIAHGFDQRFVRDCYRRLISMYGDVVLGVALLQSIQRSLSRTAGLTAVVVERAEETEGKKGND